MWIEVVDESGSAEKTQIFTCDYCLFNFRLLERDRPSWAPLRKQHLKIKFVPISGQEELVSDIEEFFTEPEEMSCRLCMLNIILISRYKPN